MRIVGFLIRLFLVVALIVWLADRPGTAQIVWRDYEISMSAAVLGLIVLAVAYAAVLLHRLWRFLRDGPRFWRLRRKISRLEEGERELARGLAAVAAGQAAEAGRHAVQARKLLGETPAVRLIQAQAAQLAGDKAAAKTLFEAMTQDKETAVLGYRGLIMSALRAGEFEEAARAAQRLEQTGADAPWLHLVRFELGVRSGDWSLAGEALARARKGKALPVPQADRQEAALSLAQAKKALRADVGREALEWAEKAKKRAPDWLPAALVLAEAQIVAGYGRAALRTIRRAFEKQPHPELVALASRAGGFSKPIDAYREIEKMTRGLRENAASLTALAEAALKAGLWGEARRFLTAIAERGEATVSTYRLLARVERSDTGNETAVSGWLAKAASAPPDPQWLCSACGAAHRAWEASCDSCGSFNKISWDVPGKKRHDVSSAAKVEALDYWG